MEPAHLAKGVHVRSQILWLLGLCRGAGCRRGLLTLSIGRGLGRSIGRFRGRLGIARTIGAVGLAAVIDIPAGALEYDADILDYPLYRPLAGGAIGERILAEFLKLLKLVAAIATLILIRRH